jgi:hypothetical protein
MRLASETVHPEQHAPFSQMIGIPPDEASSFSSGANTLTNPSAAADPTQ